MKSLKAVAAGILALAIAGPAFAANVEQCSKMGTELNDMAGKMPQIKKRIVEQQGLFNLHDEARVNIQSEISNREGNLKGEDKRSDKELQEALLKHHELAEAARTGFETAVADENALVVKFNALNSKYEKACIKAK